MWKPSKVYPVRCYPKSFRVECFRAKTFDEMHRPLQSITDQQKKGERCARILCAKITNRFWHADSKGVENQKFQTSVDESTHRIRWSDCVYMPTPLAHSPMWREHLMYSGLSHTLRAHSVPWSLIAARVIFTKYVVHASPLHVAWNAMKNIARSQIISSFLYDGLIYSVYLELDSCNGSVNSEGVECASCSFHIVSK